MRISLILAISACLLAGAGCVSPQLRPDTKVLAGIKSVYIVPMETPPLTIDAAYVASAPAVFAYSFPRYSPDMARAAGILSGIAILFELPRMQRPLVYPGELEKQLAPTKEWVVTVEFAHEAERLLAPAGRSTNISPGVRPIPGIEDRSRTALMENWMAPIRDWYNDESPSTGYAGLKSQGIDAVLEIGISNYEIQNGVFAMQVHVRLIDAGSGRLLGRAREAHVAEGLPPMDELFADAAKPFKELVTREGNQFVAKCLQELGMTNR